MAVLALALVAVPFGLLLFLVQDKWSPLLSVDQGARDDLHAYAIDHTAFVDAMRRLSTIGSAPVYLVLFGGIAAWLAWRRRTRLAIFVVVTMVGNSLLNGLVKLAVERARPVLPDPVAHANGLSFPSGHAESAIVAYGVLLVVFLPALRGAWRALAIGLGAALVAAIGFSRVALGVHFVSDVLAGYALGAAWLAVMITIADPVGWKERRRLRRTDGSSAGGREERGRHGELHELHRRAESGV
ncbi:MAG: putative rane protein [Solirubrobacterales bacterium]|nr:putative rane protein [Solirubrobacterales bacterium]